MNSRLNRSAVSWTLSSLAAGLAAAAFLTSNATSRLSAAPLAAAQAGAPKTGAPKTGAAPAPAAPANPAAPKAAPTTPAPAAPANPAAPKTAPKAAPAEAETEVEEAKALSATTPDGVAIKFSYYNAPAEEAVPIVLLHAGGGKRDDFKAVAEFLQAQGHAVVVPDLRGHGESTERTDPNTKRKTTLSYKTQNANDIKAMFVQDMAVIWDFLLAQNNDKAVNIKKLCVVGVDMGAIVAVNFVAKNWSEPDYRNQPRGKDVKAIVLVSPPTAYRGATYRDALSQPPFKGEVSTLVLVGAEESKDLSAAKALYSMMAKMAETGSNKDSKEKMVQLGEAKTKLQRTELLANPKLNLMKAVDAYVQKRLVGKNLPWAKAIVP